MYRVRICNTDYNVSKRVYYHIEGILAENRVLSSEIRAYEDTVEQLRKDIDTYQKALDEITSEKMDLEEKIEKINRTIDYVKRHWVIDNPVQFKNDIMSILEEENNETLDTNTK